MKLGTVVPLEGGPDEELRKVAELGLPCCQVVCWQPDMLTEENAEGLRQAARERGVEVVSFWAGYSGEVVWNLVEGPKTIGIVPPEHRERRTEELQRGAEFASRVGVSLVVTHAGFIPENPTDPLYAGAVEALRRVAERCKELGVSFCLETGQETPVTLLRCLRDIGTDNMGVNLDPANLLMYGKANPLDAVDIIGAHIRSLHAKDGEYPTDPYQLGVEKPLGEGRADFPRLIGKLKAMGYSGPVIIEREISGEQQIRDILRAKDILEPLC
ncbi:MAG: sugar phosphate isomerase/epimerase [Armatimonadota bacterium]|nr:MAG: sugar phosphate isomerase/epimerase [Armatimonadota bacterium]